jgi:outer membrane protein assembly factor BamB
MAQDVVRFRGKSGGNFESPGNFEERRRMRMKRAAIYYGWLAGLMLTLPPSDSLSDHPAYFRADHGLGGDGHRLPGDFGDGARLVWRRALEPGNSTPCVTSELIFVTTYNDAAKELCSVAIERLGGAVKWRRVVPTSTIEPFHPVGSPASATPAWNGRQLFVFFGSYGLLSYDAEGQLLWEKRMGPFQDEFGAASSPVLVDGLVVLNEDHDLDSFLIAADQQTGRTVWRTAREGFTRSYSTPIVYQVGDHRELVVAGALQLAAYDITTGRKRWWVNGLSRIVDSTPTVADGSIFVATWTPGGDPGERISMEPFADAARNYDRNGDGAIDRSELPAAGPVSDRFFRIDLNQNQKLDQNEWERHARVFELAHNVAMRIQPQGEGDITDRSVRWVFQRGLPTVPSSVVYKGILYMVKDSGIVTGVDAETGQLLKQGRAAGRGNYYASLVAGDDKVYLCSEGGVVTVLQAGPDWQVLSSHDFGERIMATPVIDSGRIYLRTDKALYCFAKS